MALAAAAHRSAPRGQKPARAGVRPGVPEDPGPGRETEHEQPPSPGVSSLAMPVLAGAAGEAVDRTALSYLLQQSLAAKREEEEERMLVELEVKRKVEELQSLSAATKAMVQQRATGSSSWTSALARGGQLRRELKELRGEERKKRKKRKKRLPRAPRPRLVSGCTAWFHSGYMFLSWSREALLRLIPHNFFVKVMLALYALGNLDFLRATGIWHPLVRCLSRRRSTGKFGVSWETTARYFYVRPFVFGSHLFGVRLWSTRLLTFVENDFWMDSVFITTWVDSGYMFTSVYGGFSSDCRKLRIFRSCSPSLVVDISCVVVQNADSHGPDSSSDHRDSPFAGHGG